MLAKWFSRHGSPGRGLTCCIQVCTKFDIAIFFDQATLRTAGLTSRQVDGRPGVGGDQLQLGGGQVGRYLTTSQHHLHLPHQAWRVVNHKPK